jgi:hypothetical protein
MTMAIALRLNLRRHLVQFQAGMVDGIGGTIESLFGKDEGVWKDMCVWSAIENVLSKSVISILIGETLCYDEDFIKCFNGFYFGFGAGIAVVVHLPPSLIQPLVGFLFGILVNISLH